MGTMKLTLTHGDRDYQVELLGNGRVRVDDRVFDALRQDRGAISIDGMLAWTAVQDDVRWVFWNGQTYELTARTEPRGRRARPRTASGELSAPMPATVRRILVAPGDAVKTGDSLVILEAMKMELPVRAGAAGTVRAVKCHEGELVQPGVPLIEIDVAGGK
jgi:biotin carboxyl carrier protein